MNAVAPFPPTTLKFQPVPGSRYLIQVFGQRERFRESGATPRVLAAVRVKTEEAHAYYETHGHFELDRPNEPYEGNHFLTVATADIWQWCVDHAVCYQGQIEGFNFAPSLLVLMNQPQFELFVRDFKLVPGPAN